MAEENDIERIVLVGRRSYAYAFAKYGQERRNSALSARSVLERNGVSSHMLEYGLETGMDLHELMAMSGIAYSRKKSKSLAAEGAIRVNGEIESDVRRLLNEHDFIEHGKLRISLQI
ncbi:MAG: hypothetical protein QG650_742 [Patescibacteria group bacterium]|nr:hypothetical protein [Patescibacteria group bacterium]